MQAVAAIVAGFLLGIGACLWQSRRSRRELRAFLQRLGWTEVASEPLNDRQLALVLKHISDENNQLRYRKVNLQSHLDAYNNFLEYLPIGFLLVDRDNLLLQCNRATRKLFQLQEWQPRQRVLLEWIRSYELDRLIQSARRDQDIEQLPLCREWLHYPADTPDRPIPLRGWAANLGGGSVGVFIEPRQDASAQERQQNQWTTDVAHELKTPLTSLRLVAETLHKRISPDLQSWTEGMLGEVNRLSALVQDLLELSQLDRRNQAVLKLETVELVGILHEAWESLAPLAREKQQQLSYSGPEQLWLEGDSQRLYRLWLNLLDNAIKFNRLNASVRATLTISDTHAIATVIDSGPGFASQESRTRIFERFYRTDAARARSDGGTGLGLAIARQIVELHGGTISANNSSETGGACLYFTLNCHPSAVPHNAVGL
ncbi:MAG: PAS domain-containing sensor histidine kinase [Cyanobacteria bacterium P01_F01_bin.33]